MLTFSTTKSVSPVSVATVTTCLYLCLLVLTMAQCQSKCCCTGFVTSNNKPPVSACRSFGRPEATGQSSLSSSWPPPPSTFSSSTTPSSSSTIHCRSVGTLQKMRTSKNGHNDEYDSSDSNGVDCENNNLWLVKYQRKLSAAFFGAAISFAATFAPTPLSMVQPSFAATDSGAIVSCLFSKCQLPLLKCISNPKCLANVVCINTCNNRDDEIGCQIQCGDLFENEVVGEFNKCVVSDMGCVPQKPDDGSYPVPSPTALVSKFDTKLWNGRWYITAGQNKLFDIFPCQVHFFTETSPGTFYGKLNWRIEEPDGNFFTRDALQEFVQDPQQPAHLLNHDNEYLHYEDDWYIVDYEYDDNPSGVPPFALVYYRGSNDAWKGYGGAVVYTRDSKLPESLLPRLRESAKKVGFDFDKDFTITDNTCQVMKDGEALILKEKFAGKVLLQTEEAVQAQATKFRGNAINSIKAQKIFFSGEEKGKDAQKAFDKLSDAVEQFEKETVK